MPRLAFFHTGDVHVATFTALMAELAPQVTLQHRVRADLLAAAQQPQADLAAIGVELGRELAALDGADLVVCTCSTLGSLAEAATGMAAPVWRVDRPMARQAVRLGPELLVVACVASTLAPTLALLEEEAARAGVPLGARTLVLDDLWPLFLAGRQQEYVSAIAARAEAAFDAEGAVILAQASMAPAAGLMSVPVPVFSSPRSCAEAAASFLAAKV
ncbi:hypothetical protein [Radicibacter daui]|uniref:hypothetical protein n=1 Tax=Radicibacter daui TaxID=3064829 RepID=UPI004046D6B0